MKLEGHDAAIANLFEAIRQLLRRPTRFQDVRSDFTLGCCQSPKKKTDRVWPKQS